MHVRLPKPLHGWRAFVGEVGIIVLGVLIALGFGQVVEQWQWRQEVATTRQALANEIAASARQAAERLAVEDCLHQRIGELAGRLNASNGHWRADPMPVGREARLSPHWDNLSMPRVYVVPLWGWSQDAWDTAKSSGALDHMSRAEIASYSDVYGEIAGIRGFQAQELLLESELSFLSADQQLDNRSRLDALGKLGQLDSLNSVNSGLSSVIAEQMQGLHLHVDRAAFSKELRAELSDERRYRGACVQDERITF
ncbi:MAG TPA: hypothetical protein VH392_04575 [Sphingomicrobium sp.]